ncbi:MAG: hypothetical protein Q4F77_12745 [Acinetobacter sp.]|uniref:hypothetical protein n=1 Tax=Acinetobacter sp. TaxID=472 RepID=UPI0026E0C210|nr:hypothetical protein [Acinetobacter sp.]MDO5544149.1 hypothetical protein [Acinetobacter sp.]
MIHSKFFYVVFLTLLLGSGCSKNDEMNSAVEKSPSNSKSNVKISNDPNAKFMAQQTSVNSFESSNTYNNYGFAYRYESRSGDGKEYFYKSIQEFMSDDFTNQRHILAETWTEISKEEYLQTREHYDQTRELIDLHPEILQSTPIYQKFLQFLEEQQARRAEFEKKRADFDAEFNRKRAEFDAEFNRKRTEFDKRWTESTRPSPQSKNLDTTHREEVLDDIQIEEPELSDHESQPDNTSVQ